MSIPLKPPESSVGPRSVLICHAESRLNREAVATWLASFSDLAGIVLIEETPIYGVRRIRRELTRIGVLRFADVLAFRLYYKLILARKDRRWLDRQLHNISATFRPIPLKVEIVRTSNPNSVEVEAFVKRLAPDVIIARCKRILSERIFAVPRHGTFVLHPGVCPEYRNAHGAFWALARRDLANVGLTLLKIDRGVDTGPVYGYYSYEFDEMNESHIVIMTRLVLDNLDPLKRQLLEICSGHARPLNTTGRTSAVWGQPWLTSYFRWKRAARKRHAGSLARVS